MLEGVPFWAEISLVFSASFIIGFVMVRTLSWFQTNISRRKRKHGRRDQRRLYTEAEKKLARSLSGDKCEVCGGLYGSKLQGDHWFPHARGGATTMRNLVMLCPSCNRKKSAKIPTAAETLRISIRRMLGIGYEGKPPSRVGEWTSRFGFIRNKKSGKAGK